jgi:hypothetical protein
MSDKNKEQEVIRIDLTEQQKTLVKQTIGRDAEALELDVQTLEERIAPKMFL